MIDSHVHLDAKNYEEEGGVSAVLSQARQAGVVACVAPALHFDSYLKLKSLADLHPTIFPAVGVHPHEVTEDLYSGLEARLELELGNGNPVPILGETGLEGHYDFAPMDLQRRFLRSHLDVARNLEVPCILHCRSAEELLYEELSRVRLDRPGVVHCFTGSWEWAQRFLDLGCYIGITGIVTFKNARDVAEVAQNVPLDRLLVETDGPYLAPIPHRGRTNKPEYIPLIVDAIAKLRADANREEIAAATAHNAIELFGLPKQIASLMV